MIDPRTTASQAIKRHMWFGLITALMLGGTGTSWAVLASLDSAVVTQGTVVVESNVKKVQHPTGGIVGQLNVREGQRVHKGDVVVRLDETVTRANLAIVVNELTATRARVARLIAERDGRSDIAFPDDILSRSEIEPDVDQMLRGERARFKSRLVTRLGQKSQLLERVGQLKDEINGLNEQRRSIGVQQYITKDELNGLLGLRAQGLVQKPRITALERELARNEGLLGELSSKISQTQGRISETELQILQLEKDAQSEISKELREADTKIGELQERKVAAEDQLRRIDIRAPISGVVHQLAVHTVGGVINQTEPLMLIVPEADRLIVEVRVNPQDIDQVNIGQSVRVRFSAFNQRTTPEMAGTLFRLAADLTRDQQSGLTYYVAGVNVAEGELRKLEGLKLIPGMPAEAYIKTGERTPVSFLVKPLTDQMQRAMRER